MKKQTISVLIPTLGRKNEVIETVQSLLKQTRLPDEIIVVDQNTPAIEELDKFLATVPLVKHIKNDKAGLCLNYNKAITSASSDILLFIDDDVVTDSSLIEFHLRHYVDRVARVGAVAGRIIELDQPVKAVASYSYAGKYSRWTGAVHANFDSLLASESDFGQGCNISFLREPLLQIGGFDLGFTGNAYFFEPDACLRLKELGFKVLFDPMAKLDHLRAPSGGARVTAKAEHTFYFVRNGLRLYRRHSPKLGLPFYLLKLSGYISAKAVKNLNPEIFVQGIKAIGEGIRQDMEFKG